jgi:transposase-like protein
MEGNNILKRQSLRDEIVRLYEVEKKTVTEIAAQLGCTKSNVSLTLKRVLSWNHNVSPALPDSVLAWVMKNAELQGTPPAVFVRTVIIEAYDKAKD